MTFRFGKGWVLRDETNGEGGDAGGGAGAGAPAGDGADAGGGTGDAGDVSGAGGGSGDAAGGDQEGAPPKDMKAAIDAALGYTAGVDGKQEEKKETETSHANGKPKKDEAGNELDADGKVTKPAAPKQPKTAAELDLTPDQLKALKPESQHRFREVIGALKTSQANEQKLTGENKVLREARDSLMGVLQDTKTSKEELIGYLNLNALLKSGTGQGLEQALGIVERQRAAIYRALGREPQGGGIDLLKDFPDLTRQVEESQITREAALELAKGRRETAARQAAQQRQAQQQRQQQESQNQGKAESEQALKDIQAWTTGLTKTDLDYKAKEDRLLAKLDGVLKNYPPSKWLTTLKLLYEGIEITKAPSQDGGTKPLRPSGARPGAKKPASMLEAISQGLGYAEKQ